MNNPTDNSELEMLVDNLRYLMTQEVWDFVARDKAIAIITTETTKARLEAELEYAIELQSYDEVLNDKYLMDKILEREEWCREELEALKEQTL